MRYNDAGIVLVEANELSQDILLDIRNWRNDEKNQQIYVWQS